MKTVDTIRFTRDVDALALGIARDRVPEMVERALMFDLDDGLWFGDLQVEDLKDQGPYGGYRFNFAFQIGDPPHGPKEKLKKLSRIHVDIGFGDAVDTLPKKQTMRSVLGSGKPVSWSVYPLEHIFAEKLETLFSRGSANSRAKDIYDLVLIFPKCGDLVELTRVIRATFKNRETFLPASFEAGARAFDLTVLKSAWRSVELNEVEKSFDEAWSALLAVLRVIDLKSG